MKRALLLMLPLALAACDPVEMARRDDPEATACRERFMQRFGVEFEETTAVSAGRNELGLRNFIVSARGQSFRCTLDAQGGIAGMIRVRS